MDFYNADLHIHSPHSIAVSKNLDLDSMAHTSKMKGLSVLGTGDITQPDWRNYLERNLEKKGGVYRYKNISFIIQTELEDEESIHHVVLLPTIESGAELMKKIDPHTKNVTGNYAGRPHVNVPPAEILDIVHDVGGVCGPAHAFTPFKAIFRANKFSNLIECYGEMADKVDFLELGLSADTDLADRLACLSEITFLSNSDAHSEGPQSLGREFNKFEIEEPSFDEIVKALKRQDARKITLNVGMEPKLGKYPMLFCRRCRKRVRLYLEENLPERFADLNFKQSLTEKYSSNDNFIYYVFKNETDLQNFKSQIGQGNVKCVSCEKTGKSSKIKLGVFDRIDEIADYPEPNHPDHRPPYLDIIPLVEMLRVVAGVKSVKTKSVKRPYKKLIHEYGNEFEILTNNDILPKLRKDGFEKLADIIEAFHEKKVDFVPGGGGKYGKIRFDAI